MRHEARTFLFSAALCPILGYVIAQHAITFCWFATVIPRAAECCHFHYQGKEEAVRFLGRVMTKLREWEDRREANQ